MSNKLWLHFLFKFISFNFNLAKQYFPNESYILNKTLNYFYHFHQIDITLLNFYDSWTCFSVLHWTWYKRNQNFKYEIQYEIHISIFISPITKYLNLKVIQEYKMVTPRRKIFIPFTDKDAYIQVYLEWTPSLRHPGKVSLVKVFYFWLEITGVIYFDLKEGMRFAKDENAGGWLIRYLSRHFQS